MLNYRKIIKKAVVVAVALVLATSSMQTRAADWDIFGSYLYPGESDFSNTISIKSDSLKYGKVKILTMAGGGRHKVMFSIYKGPMQMSKSTMVTGKAIAKIPYNNIPGKDSKCKLRVVVPNTQSAPLRVEGHWTS